VVLFQEDAAERARETGAAERTLQRRADQFEQHGMMSLFPKEPVRPSETSRSLPPDMRQLIVDLHAEYPALMQRMEVCFASSAWKTTFITK
jgi:putative transposase